jgi:2-phospho-L-lactate guanylyltransferase
VQGSVHDFDETSGAGGVLLDDGRRLAFAADVFAVSGLRHLRVGQRLSIDVDGDAVTRLWIVGIGEDQPIR